MSITLIGVFDDYGVANKVVENLEPSTGAGDQISVLGSSQVAAQSLRPETHNTGAIEKTVKIEILGDILGALMGILAVVSFYHGLSGLTLLMAIISGAIGGGYVGLVAAAILVPKLDIADDDLRFHEEEVTQGQILVGVETKNINELAHAEHIMEDMGVIRLIVNPEMKEAQAVIAECKRRHIGYAGQKGAAVILSLILCSAMFAISAQGQTSSPEGLSVHPPAISSNQVQQSDTALPPPNIFASRQIGPEYPVDGITKAVLLAFLSVLLLACPITAYFGLHTKGARKWLSFDVKPAGH